MRGTCAACQVCYYSCPRIELPVGEIEQRVFGRARTPEERERNHSVVVGHSFGGLILEYAISKVRRTLLVDHGEVLWLSVDITPAAWLAL